MNIQFIDAWDKLVFGESRSQKMFHNYTLSLCLVHRVVYCETHPDEELDSLIRDITDQGMQVDIEHGRVSEHI